MSELLGEAQRYSRHMVLPEVGVAGQELLKAASVLVVGAGGLGSPVALYLAAAGVGKLGLVDFDSVDLTNLHRQVLHGTSDVGRPKVSSGTDALRELNPHVDVVGFEERLSAGNALEIIGGFDYVADGTDNFPTRYLVNDVCVLLGKPNVYGSVFRFEGQATVFCAPGGPCYRCLYPSPPPSGAVPSCADAGVLGVLPGVIGMIQATETVKAILGIGESLVGRLLMYDALEMRFSEVSVARDEACPVCGDSPTIRSLVDYGEGCVVEVGALEVLAMRARGEDFTLLDVREPQEWAQARVPGSVLISLGEVGDRLGELDRSKRTVVLCHVGIRSAAACEILTKAGFSSAVNLRGGIVDWMRCGGPVEP
jgi:adenylyltransferase/sulfurtransferase